MFQKPKIMELNFRELDLRIINLSKKRLFQTRKRTFRAFSIY